MSKELLNPEGQILVLEGKASPNFESAKPNEALPVLVSSLHCLPTSRNRPVMIRDFSPKGKMALKTPCALGVNMLRFIFITGLFRDVGKQCKEDIKTGKASFGFADSKFGDALPSKTRI